MERQQGDLFSEIHMSEIKKFEDMLSDTERDRDELRETAGRLQTKLDESAAKMAGNTS